MIEQKPFDIEFAVDTVERIIIRKLATIGDDEVRREIITCILTSFYSVIPQLITSNEQLFNTVWTEIRTKFSQHVLNFLLVGTSEMLMHFKSSGWEYPEVVKFFNDTIIFPVGKNSAMEENIFQQLVTEKELKEILSENAWYIFIILTTMTNVKITWLAQLEETKKPGKQK